MAAGPGGTANKYVIGLDVEEYRKGNGGAFKVGTSQRNVLVNVISSGNASPVLTAEYNGASVAPNTIIDVNAGTTVIMNFGASDADTWDVVSPGTNATSILPRSNFIVTLASNPNGGRITWTPIAAEARNEPYFFNVTATDNACPYPASITHTYGIRVRNITGISAEQKNAVKFLAFPNPSDGDVNFKLSGGKQVNKIVICNMLGQEIDQVPVSDLNAGEQNVGWENSKKFSAGTYVAKLLSADKTIQTLKFTKLQ